MPPVVRSSVPELASGLPSMEVRVMAAKSFLISAERCEVWMPYFLTKPTSALERGLSMIHHIQQEQPVHFYNTWVLKKQNVPVRPYPYFLVKIMMG